MKRCQQIDEVCANYHSQCHPAEAQESGSDRQQYWGGWVGAGVMQTSMVFERIDSSDTNLVKSGRLSHQFLAFVLHDTCKSYEQQQIP